MSNQPKNNHSSELQSELHSDLQSEPKGFDRIRNWLATTTLRSRLLLLTLTLTALGGSVGILGIATQKNATQSISNIQKFSASSQWLTLSSMKNEEMIRALWSAFGSYKQGKGTEETLSKKVQSNLTHLKNLLEQSKNSIDADTSHSKAIAETLSKFNQSRIQVEQIHSLLIEGKESADQIKSRIDTASEFTNNLNIEVMESLIQVADLAVQSYDNAKKGERRYYFLYGGAVLIGLIGAMLTFFYVLRLARDLGKMSKNLRKTSSALTEATEALDVTGKDLSEGVGNQQAALTTAMAAIEEFSATISHSNASASSTLDYAKEAQSKSESGKVTITDLSASMAEVATVSQQLQEINAVVAEMQKKTHVIHEIVFKTQILSFNASIEAARAGQHGRGFAVVAAEMGELATISGKAAEDIRKLLNQSKEKTGSIIENIESRIEIAKETSNRCLDAFNGISDAINTFVPMLDEIRTAFVEQQTGVGQTRESFDQISHTADDNSKAAKKVSGQAPLLRSEAAEMSQLILRLDDIVFGKKISFKKKKGRTPELECPAFSDDKILKTWI